MKVFIVLAHPDPHSLNASLAKYAVEVLEAAGHEVKVRHIVANMHWLLIHHLPYLCLLLQTRVGA